MPPPLALLLCTGFVIYLLRYDRKQAPTVSFASWVPTLWLFAISTKSLGAWFASRMGDESSSVLDEVFLVSLAVLGCVIIARRRFDWWGALRGNPWLLVLIGYMLVSVVWSDLPLTCIKRWIRQMVGVVVILVVLSEEDPKQTTECLLRRLAYVLLPYSIVLIKYFPNLGVLYGRWSGDIMWVGVADHKTGLGRISLVATAYLSWSVYRKWRLRHNEPLPVGFLAEVAVFLLALKFLFNPDGKASATAIAAFGLGVSVYLSFWWLGRRGITPSPVLAMLGVLGLVTFGISMPLSGGSVAGGLNESMGRDSTFTGRSEIWEEIAAIAMRHPILGCGFDSYWTAATRELHAMSHSHCAYLELFNEIGAVGIGLYTLFLMSVVQRAFAGLQGDYDWGSFCIAYMCMALLHGATESSINSFTVLLGGVILLMSFVCGTPSHKLEPEGQNVYRHVQKLDKVTGDSGNP